MKLIYENYRPTFYILVDEYQWIIARVKRLRKDNEIEYASKTFHPNLANLFDELIEKQFKDNATQVKNLKDLQVMIEKVYSLIEKQLGRVGQEA